MTSVSVIGCGNMGGALIKGLSQAGYDEIIACDLDTDALETVAPYSSKTTTDPEEAATAEVVFVAVKPDIVGTVLESIDLSPEQTLVTIAAGVPIDFVAGRTDATVVRVMPNLAAETRNMAAAVTWSGAAADDVRAILDDLGTFVEIEEDLMDVATALNGSGPAFVFYLLKAMKEGAVEEGLEADKAAALTAQTFIGAAETVLHSEESVDELIDMVCSPNGTTIEGMKVLWESDVEIEVGNALSAAAERSRELSQGFDDE